MKSRKPFVPSERSDTVRQTIASLLRDEALTAMDISVEAGIPVSDVYDHLEHLRHSLQREAASLVLLPACVWRRRLSAPHVPASCRSPLSTRRPVGSEGSPG